MEKRYQMKNHWSNWEKKKTKKSFNFVLGFYLFWSCKLGGTFFTDAFNQIWHCTLSHQDFWVTSSSEIADVLVSPSKKNCIFLKNVVRRLTECAFWTCDSSSAEAQQPWKFRARLSAFTPESRCCQSRPDPAWWQADDFRPPDEKKPKEMFLENPEKNPNEKP